MRPIGSSLELERRRKLAVQRLQEGFSAEDVADILGVNPASVRRWWASFRRHGARALAARPVRGRPCKLSSTQEKIVRRWLQSSPSEHGLPGCLWSAPRLAKIIQQEFGVCFHPRYLARWLRARGFTLQLPRRIPRERNPRVLADWLARDWPRIQKEPDDEARASF